jgi:hypothetical protein
MPDSTESYPNGASVMLTANPTSDSIFTGWSGCPQPATTTCQVTVDRARTVTARFNKNRYVLTVRKAGNGSGTVTSNPSGINCGADCNHSYTVGTKVRLIAKASQPFGIGRLERRELWPIGHLSGHAECGADGHRHLQAAR